MGIDFLLERIRERQAVAATAGDGPLVIAVPELLSGGPEPLYHHHNPSLAIDFQVQRLPLAGLQVLDPRLVRIAPGCRNESHRHAHESIFVVLAGEGELRIGAETVPLKAGDVACVPRWLVHQSRNSSSSEELQLLAITDFGLTSGVLGDYDQRTRLKGGGADALVSAEEAVDALTATALNHRAVRHPYLAALADGTLPDPAWALADFARQYQGYAAHFPRYLTALISRLESPAHRQALLENLMEESGQYDTAELETLAGLGIKAEWIKGVPHPQLFERFRLAVGGADGDAAAPEEPEVVAWREMLLVVLSQGSAAEAVGALGLGTEAIVSTLYQAFVAAIERHGSLDPRDTVFFPLHTAVDDAHQASLRQIAIDCAGSERGRAELALGMHKALALRDSFWSWLHERAQRRRP
jgi:mannose-6-phosphate isomerase-like protein (cupin superfamily)/pyrroloquinoline quinone (PQQ) biosynthesis protein C